MLKKDAVLIKYDGLYLKFINDDYWFEEGLEGAAVFTTIDANSVNKICKQNGYNSGIFDLYDEIDKYNNEQDNL